MTCFVSPWLKHCVGTNNAHNIVHSKSHSRPKSNSMRFGQPNSCSLPSFQSIAGICHLNNLHEKYHLSFRPTASQYRECSDGNSDEEEEESEDQKVDVNQDDNDDDDRNDTDPEG